MQWVSEIVDKTIRKLPVSKKIREQMIIDAWPVIVGEKIADKTRALTCENGTLLVWVRDSVWAQHISLQQRRIINALNRHARTRSLTEIRFRAGGIDPGPADPIQNNRPVEKGHCNDVLLAGKDLEKVEEALQVAGLDRDLEELLRKILISQKKKIVWLFAQGCLPCEVCGMPVEDAEWALCLCCRIEKNHMPRFQTVLREKHGKRF